MSEVTLNDRIVKVDISEMTVQEWRDFISSRGDAETEDAFIAKFTDVTPEEIHAMSYRKFRAIVKAVILAAQDPLTDPN